MKHFFKTFNKFYLFLIIVIVASCNNNQHPDVSHIDVKLNILRFEKDLFEYKLKNYDEFKSKYGYFIDDYLLKMFQFSSDTQVAFTQLMALKNDERIRKIYTEVKNKYDDFSFHEKALTSAYKYFKYHFPKEKIPNIITCINGFNIYNMNGVGIGYQNIGLDMHLNPNFKGYDYVQIEKYWHKILTEETIAPMNMVAHINDLFSTYNKSEKFIDDMVYQGKLLYCLDAFFPQLKDHFKIGLTETELKWMQNEEKNIWALLVKDKYFYETSKMRYMKLLTEGPRTAADHVPYDAPAMIGKYAGWMMVRNYMKKNKNVTLEQLMKNSNSQEIMQKSGYKPN